MMRWMHSRILTIESGRNGSTLGRDIYYNHIVVQEDLLLGSWLNVKLTKSKTNYFIGVNIKKNEAGNQIHPANIVT